MDYCLSVKRSPWDKRAVTAIQIARNWDELWRDAEQILVGQEPEPQIYTTPTDEQVETPRNTGHAPPEVETGTPPIETGQQVDLPNNTSGQTREQPKAEDYVMQSRRDVRGHDDAGGYTIERHIGKSDSWLQKRAATLGKPYEASTFTDTASANLTQARAIKENRAKIEAFLKSKRKRPLRLEVEMNRPIGRVVNRSGKVWATNKAFIIIDKEASKLGYKILTSYPVRQ